MHIEITAKRKVSQENSAQPAASRTTTCCQQCEPRPRATRSYREPIATVIQHLRPNVEIIVVDPAELADQVELWRQHKALTTAIRSNPHFHSIFTRC
jgi:hypothetical protein